MTDNNADSRCVTKKANGANFLYPYLFRLLHWLLAVTVVVLVLTGLSQYAMSRPEWSLCSGVLPQFFWPGRVHLFHALASLVYFPALVAVFWIWWRAKVRLRLTQLILLGGGLLTIASGLVLLDPLGPPILYAAAFWIHAVVGLLLIPIGFCWHAMVGLTRSRRRLPAAFDPISRAKWKPLLWFVPLAAVTTCLQLNGVPTTPGYRELAATRIRSSQARDKPLDELPFEEAPPLVIELAAGTHFDRGRTAVTLRALYDDVNLYVMAEWADPSEDRRNMPWKKTSAGWQRLLSDEDDENVYYEDKFSLIFPIEPDWQFERLGCTVHCHAGGGRKYGYKGSDRPVDVWHWKSTRTDPVGQVDDKYWSQVDLEARDAGRHGDPGQAAYEKNVSEDKARPAFLPDGPDAVKQGVILDERAVEYTPEAAAKIPAGTIIPGIVAKAAAGDRGDVSCLSRYDAGRWRLYIRRALETGSKYDVKFVPGETLPFGCAAFDRSSKRHAYALPVYRLVLKQ